MISTIFKNTTIQTSASAVLTSDGTGLTWTTIYDDKAKEEKIREENPFVKDLYEQYRVALILAGGEDL